MKTLVWLFLLIALIASGASAAQTAVNSTKPKPKVKVRHVSPLVARLSYRWATEISNIQDLDNQEGRDEMARAQMSTIRDQIKETSEFDICRKTIACANNDIELLRMATRAATKVMHERNDLKEAIDFAPSAFDKENKTESKHPDYNISLVHMHDADRCISAIQRAAALGFITSDDVEACNFRDATAKP